MPNFERTAYQVLSGPVFDHDVLTNALVTNLTFCKGHYQIPIGIDRDTGEQIIGLGDVTQLVPSNSSPILETRHLCDKLHCGCLGENCAAKRIALERNQNRNSWTDAVATLVRANHPFKP